MTANTIYTATLTGADTYGDPRIVKVAWVPERIQGVNLDLEEQGEYVYAWDGEDLCPVSLVTSYPGDTELRTEAQQFTGDYQVIVEAMEVATLAELTAGTYVVLRDSYGVGSEWSDDRDADDEADEAAVRDAQTALQSAAEADAGRRATQAAKWAVERITARDRFVAELLIERGRGDDPLISFDSGRAYWDSGHARVVTAIAWYGEGETDFVIDDKLLVADDVAWMEQVADEMVG